MSLGLELEPVPSRGLETGFSSRFPLLLLPRPFDLPEEELLLPLLDAIEARPVDEHLDVHPDEELEEVCTKGGSEPDSDGCLMPDLECLRSDLQLVFPCRP